MDVRNERGEAFVLKTYEGLAAAAMRKPPVTSGCPPCLPSDVVSSFPTPNFLLRCMLTRNAMSQPRGKGGPTCARNDSLS